MRKTPLYPPAKCRACGQVVPATNWEFTNCFHITMKGGTFHPCPLCGGTCDLLEGTYHAIGDVMHVIGGPRSTLETLQALAESLAASKAEGSSPEEAIRKAAAVSPALATAAAKIPWASTWAFLSLVLAAAQLVVSLRQPPPQTNADASQLFASAIVELRRTDEKEAEEAARILHDHLAPGSGKAASGSGSFSPRTESLLQDFAQKNYPNRSNRIQKNKRGMNGHEGTPKKKPPN